MNRDDGGELVSPMDYLEGGDSIDLFLYDFPSVRREEVIAFLEYAKRGALEAVPA